MKSPHPIRTIAIAKNQNTFLKKKREMDRKAKAEAKRERRAQRKKRESEESSQEPPTSTEATDHT